MTDRAEILAIISDLTKDATGSRVRADYAAMTDSELNDTYNYYCDLLKETMLRECISHLQAQKDWELSMQGLMAMGAASFGHAIAWDMQAEGVEPGEFGFYCYLKDLSYQLEERIKCEVNASQPELLAA